MIKLGYVALCLGAAPSVLFVRGRRHVDARVNRRTRQHEPADFDRLGWWPWQGQPETATALQHDHGQPARLGGQGTTARLDRQDRHLGPTGKGAKKWSNRWKAALNAFDITFDGRISATRR
jgi:hypothetical protein